MIEIHERIIQNLSSHLSAEVTQKYGAHPDQRIQKQLHDELAAMVNSKGLFGFAAAYEMTLFLRANHWPYKLNGAVSSSFIAYLLGMTLTNPLQAHQVCPNCNLIVWRNKEYEDGFDIPPMACSNCGNEMESDGHDIDWRIFWLDPTPVTEILVAISERQEIVKWLEENEILKSLGQMDQHIAEDGELFSAQWTGFNCVLVGESELLSNIYEPKATAKEKRKLIENWITKKQCTLKELEVTFSDFLRQVGKDYQMSVGDSCRISFRDDLFKQLKNYGFDDQEAWNGMKQASRGKGLPPCASKQFDQWFLDECKTLKYVWPKSACVENVLFQNRK